MGHNEFVSSIAISPDSKLIVSGSVDKTIRIWSMFEEGSDDHEKIIKGHNDWIN